MHGLVLVDKGAGMSSARTIDPVRKALRMRRRVGHAGTLDPLATGALIVLCGDATRLTEKLLELPKTYHATVVFGERTQTLDPEGEVVERADPGASAPPDLDRALGRFQGEIEQVPPAYSALKVGGKPAYKLARKGRAPRLSPRKVVIHRIGLREVRWPEVDIEVTCGSGTYLRALARDLGESLNLPAGLRALRRTSIGPFLADDGIPIDSGARIPRGRVLAALQSPKVISRAVGLPELRLTLPESRVYIRGNTVDLATNAIPGETYAILDDRGELLLGIGRINADGTLRPKLVMTQGVEAVSRRIEPPP